ncbi:MAG: DUF882 domain-containing protein [Formivibrio sp.]|nr:DUF882 domain-containing protein [Formivibrio sp.]
MTESRKFSRRHFLRHTAKLAVAGAVLPLSRQTLAALPKPASFSLPKARSLAFEHTHTGEHLALVYAEDGQYIPESLNTLNHFLRDHYTGAVGQIDPALFDLLFQMKQNLSCEQSFQVISGYRCPITNAKLHNSRGGGVANHSLHMEGKAIDIRLAGLPLTDLRDTALSLRVGGVGFYPQEQFVHVDTGRVRTWHE